MNTWIFRQWDIPIFSLSSLPSGADPVSFHDSCTVAEGEVTGHTHTLFPTKNDDMLVYKVGGVFVLHALVDIPLRHQEHKEVIIPAGFWSFGREVQRDPFLDTISKVTD